jgi:hypothetical protein
MLNILVIEDKEADLLLIELSLKKKLPAFRLRRVGSKEELEAAIAEE